MVPYYDGVYLSCFHVCVLYLCSSVDDLASFR
uniref:Uncharacterized protein n=1 Tax=Arundo donax TaxID=35708 RepID=A0A0A8ZD29_ARUDO